MPSSGWILWDAFMALDSDRYPVRTYGDLFHRLFGSWARHLVNVGQAIQLIIVLAILILSSGQSISQISQGEERGEGLCFVVCVLVFVLAGWFLGQTRTLKRFGWFAGLAVCIVFLTAFIW